MTNHPPVTSEIFMFKYSTPLFAMLLFCRQPRGRCCMAFALDSSPQLLTCHQSDHMGGSEWGGPSAGQVMCTGLDYLY